MIAWLDASREDQRRMREIVNLFSQAESRDELGLGQVRDTFSDALFPGTSTLHTRARYLLFVPWCFTDAAARSGTAARAERRAAENERALIGGLRELGATDGLIGRVAGVAVKTLPSALYWGALRQYGILRVAEPLDALGIAAPADPGQDELTDRPFSAWAPTLPPVPPGFPRHPQTGFELSRAEAGWLQERLLASTEGTLLHHLASDGHRPQRGWAAPWEDPACYTSPPQVLALLEHARLFSLAVQGAAFLYNLLIAERYEAARHTRVRNPVQHYRDRLAEWAKECQGQDGTLSGWDRRVFWHLIRELNPTVRPATHRFLDLWFDWVCRLDLDGAADDRALRGLVASRERLQKGTQSRLVNDRLLASWSGQAGTGRLTYRWAQVNRMLQDLHDGLETAHAAA
jgi:Family of unknown function (DUF6361)